MQQSSSQSSSSIGEKSTPGSRMSSHFQVMLSQIVNSHASQKSIFYTMRLSAEETERMMRNRWSIPDTYELSSFRMQVFKIVYTTQAEWVSSVVTVLNFVTILIETDIGAQNEPIPLWLVAWGAVCLAYFLVELILRLYVERQSAAVDGWNVLDMLVVSSGVVGLAHDISGAHSKLSAPLRSLRCLRLVRILKAASLVPGARHLRSLVRSIEACFKLLFWTFPIIFIFMTMWATLAVQVLHPLMDGVAAKTTAWSGCDRCVRSFDSIMAANLTLFQTIFAGDSWGLVAIPVIEAHPWTVLIFVGSVFTIATGVLNLVVAILVDAAAEARASDIEMRAIEAKETELAEKHNLNKMFAQIDGDGNGGLSFEELMDGSKNISELEQMLTMMGIQGDELQQLFAMLDEDGSGEVDPDEFVDTLYRLKCGDNKTAATFVKRYVIHLKENQLDMKRNLASMQKQLSDLTESLGCSPLPRADNTDDGKDLATRVGEPLVHVDGAVASPGDMITPQDTVKLPDANPVSVDIATQERSACKQKMIDFSPNGSSLWERAGTHANSLLESTTSPQLQKEFQIHEENELGQRSASKQRRVASMEDRNGVGVAQLASEVSLAFQASLDMKLKGIEAHMHRVCQELCALKGCFHKESGLL